MDYAQLSQEYDGYPSNWPFESYLGPLLQDTRFLSYIMFPGIPDAPHIYHWQAAETLQQSPASPPVIRHPRMAAQYSRTRGGSVRGSVGRSSRRKAHRESKSYGPGQYTTLSRHVTILPPNQPYRYDDYPPTPNAIRLARKPRTWRKGYKSPSKRGIGTYLGNISNLILRSPSSYRLPGPLHPLLSYRSHLPTALVYDLRTPPGPESGLQIKALGRPATALDLYQLATSPPTHRPLLIWHPKLPWKVRIEPGPIGITIQDVLMGMYEQLRSPIAHDDYYTVGLASADRELISGVFHQRCGGDPGEVLGGVRRVDFLGREFCFVGLSRSRNGTWEMKTAVPERQRMMLD